MDNYKRVEQAVLQKGDCLLMGYCADKVIARFEEYKGVFDFIARVAVTALNSARSIYWKWVRKGHRRDISIP